MSGFTPGPWEACDPGDYGDFDGESRVVLGNDMRIAVVHWHDGDCRAENDANANLIAAAPKLYEAAVLGEQYDALLRLYEGPLDVLCDGDVTQIDAAYDAWQESLRAALELARGTQQ